jgi:hypothetical protein
MAKGSSYPKNKPAPQHTHARDSAWGPQVIVRLKTVELLFPHLLLSLSSLILSMYRTAVFRHFDPDINYQSESVPAHFGDWDVQHI